MPFVKGQTGNAKGAPPKEKRFSEVLNRAIVQDKSKRLREAAEQLLTHAASGEPWALQMLADRLDGKPAQAITGGDGGPLTVEIVRFADSDSG